MGIILWTASLGKMQAQLSLPLYWQLAFHLGVKESQFASVPWVLVFSLFLFFWVTEKLVALVVNVKTVFACSWDRTTGSLPLRHHFVLVLGFLLRSRGASAQIFYPCWCRKHSSGPQGKWWWWAAEAHVSVSVCLPVDGYFLAKLPDLILSLDWHLGISNIVFFL